MQNICECCRSNDIIEVYNESFFDLPILKCQKCTSYFVKNKEKIDLKKYYNETYWNVFQNINKKKIVNQRIDEAYLRKKLPKFLQIIIESTGIRKALSYSQYNFLKPFLKGKNLLDIGSGEGNILELFEKKKFNVTGIEPSEKNIKIINKKLKKGICKQGFIETELNFETKFDIIIMSHVLEHVIDCRKILENLKKSLSKNGLLFIEVPNCGNKKYLEESINTQQHIHHFTKNGLQELLKSLGFQIIKTETMFSEVSSFYEHFKYFLFWLIKKDYFIPISENHAKYLRIIVKI